MPIDTRHEAIHHFFTLGDEPLTDEVDQLVTCATNGDSRAAGSLSIAYGPTLLDEIRAELGPEHEADDGDVLQAFFLDMLDGKLTAPSIRGSAVPWMKHTVRVLAQRHLSRCQHDLERALAA